MEHLTSRIDSLAEQMVADFQWTIKALQDISIRMTTMSETFKTGMSDIKTLLL